MTALEDMEHSVHIDVTVSCSTTSKFFAKMEFAETIRQSTNVISQTCWMKFKRIGTIKAIVTVKSALNLELSNILGSILMVAARTSTDNVFSGIPIIQMTQ